MNGKFWQGFEKTAASLASQARGMGMGATSFMKTMKPKVAPAMALPGVKTPKMPEIAKAPKQYAKGISTTPI